MEVWNNLHVNNGHFPKNSKGHIFKKTTTTEKHKPQSSATKVMTAGIIKAGDNKWKFMPLSTASEIQFNEVSV